MLTKIFMVIYSLKMGSILLTSVAKLPMKYLSVPFIDKESEVQEN